MHDQLLGLHNIHKAYRHTDDQLRIQLFLLDQLIKANQCCRCISNSKDQLFLVVPFAFAVAATSSSDMKQ